MSGVQCVLLADRNHGLTEGLRELLKEVFDAVAMVADEASLFELAAKMRPTVTVVDLSLVQGDNLDWLKRLRRDFPDTRIVVVSAYDEPLVRARIMDMGADGFVLRRSLATDLLPMVEAVLENAVHQPKETA